MSSVRLVTTAPFGLAHGYRRRACAAWQPEPSPDQRAITRRREGLAIPTKNGMWRPWLGPIASATGNLVHLAARIWTLGQTSGTLEDRCPDREFAMERVTASARP